MFGIMRYIAEAIVEAQVKEAKLRKDMQDQIEYLRGKVQSLNMRNDNQAVLIGKLRGQLEKNRRDYCTVYGGGGKLCCDKLAYTSRCASCLMAELGRIGTLPHTIKVDYGQHVLDAMAAPTRNPPKNRYIVDTSSTRSTHVYKASSAGTPLGYPVARFAYGAEGYAMACQYADFLNSLEG
ncbi:hypothetical protein [Stenotrophomonas phage BUCT609]|uniref:Uncharacterized protein n=1 Tax=Stenotrophomonas phage BUCT609 TaxID=2834250 RepID=A0A8E6PM05_9CAUD|nr:hypothetical protein [Stenotrophomonas phage BUCT609]